MLCFTSGRRYSCKLSLPSQGKIHWPQRTRWNLNYNAEGKEALFLPMGYTAWSYFIFNDTIMTFSWCLLLQVTCYSLILLISSYCVASLSMYRTVRVLMLSHFCTITVNGFYFYSKSIYNKDQLAMKRVSRETGVWAAAMSDCATIWTSRWVSFRFNRFAKRGAGLLLFCLHSTVCPSSSSLSIFSLLLQSQLFQSLVLISRSH